MPSQNGFWTSLADSNGNRIVGSELQLSPAPSMVEYPPGIAGQLIETVDGSSILQSPTRDPRTRAWVWENWPGDRVTYQTITSRLMSLRARWRYQNGLSPYVYLLDTVTGKFERDVWESHTVSSVSGSTITLTSNNSVVNQYADIGWLEVTGGTGLGSGAMIVSNTATTVTISGTLQTQVAAGSTVTIRYRYPDWFRVRVTDVAREIAEGRPVITYKTTKLVFIVDDASWNLF